MVFELSQGHERMHEVLLRAAGPLRGAPPDADDGPLLAAWVIRLVAGNPMPFQGRAGSQPALLPSPRLVSGCHPRMLLGAGDMSPQWEIQDSRLENDL